MLRKIFILMALSFFLSGCGFHLRGHEPLPMCMRVLFLQPNDPYSNFTKVLEQTFRSSGVRLVCNPAAAPVTLAILADHFGQTTTSVGSSGQVTTYLLTYSIVYQLKDSYGNPLQCPQTITSTRTYSITSNQILSDTSALDTLKDDMVRDLIFQMLNRLRAPATMQILSRI